MSTSRLAQWPEERADVVDERPGPFHRSEVPTRRHAGPALHVVSALGPAARRLDHFPGEDRAVCPSRAGNLVGEASPRETLAEVGERRFGNGDAKGLDLHALSSIAGAGANATPASHSAPWTTSSSLEDARGPRGMLGGSASCDLLHEHRRDPGEGRLGQGRCEHARERARPRSLSWRATTAEDVAKQARRLVQSG